MKKNYDIWYLTIFQLNIYRSHGIEFQKLFNKVMTAYYGENFQTVRPYGNLGDRGNDGYLKNEQHYFQLYAPLSASQIKIPQVINKLEKDFFKLKNAFSIKKYTFVMNDKFEGIPSLVHLKLEELEKNYGIKTFAKGADWLLKIYSELKEEDKSYVISFISPLSVPLEMPKEIAAGAIKKVLDWIVSKLYSLDSFSLLRAPKIDFDKKIKFNKLNMQFGEFLKNFSYYIPVVDELTEEHSELLQGAGEVLKDLYEKYKEEFKSFDNKADLIFIAILEDIVPKAKEDELTPEVKAMLKGYQDAALVLMSKFFEVCDVYEEPPRE